MKSFQYLWAALLFLTVASASALTVSMPDEVQSPVLLNISLNATQDSISYTIEPLTQNGSCTNCSSLGILLNATPGNYTLTVQTQLGNVTETLVKNFTVLAPEFSVTINDPNNETYSSPYVPLYLVTSETVDSLAYRVDGGNLTVGCENCSSFNTTMQLDFGNHNVTAVATLGAVQKISTVYFAVDNATNSTNTTNSTNSTNSTALSLTVVTPQTTQYTASVPLRFETNMPATLSYELAGANSTGCTNCTLYTETKTIAAGNYTLIVRALTANESVNKTVNFTVANATNQTPVNQTPINKTENGSRYTLGLNQLPQAVEAGTISDAELAALIRNSTLNPGVINRLVKTGKLGNESITAIIETQRTPPGIWAKVAGFFGVHIDTPKEKLAKQYKLDDTQLEALAAAPDVSEHTAMEVKKELSKKKQAPGQQKKLALENGTNSTNKTVDAPKDNKPEKNDSDKPGKADEKPAKEDRAAQNDRAEKSNNGKNK